MSRMKDHVEYQRVLLKASQQMIKIIKFDTPCKKKFAGWLAHQALVSKKYEISSSGRKKMRKKCD